MTDTSAKSHANMQEAAKAAEAPVAPVATEAAEANAGTSDEIEIKKIAAPMAKSLEGAFESCLEEMYFTHQTVALDAVNAAKASLKDQLRTAARFGYPTDEAKRAIQEAVREKIDPVPLEFDEEFAGTSLGLEALDKRNEGWKKAWIICRRVDPIMPFDDFEAVMCRSSKASMNFVSQTIEEDDPPIKFWETLKKRVEKRVREDGDQDADGQVAKAPGKKGDARSKEGINSEDVKKAKEDLALAHEMARHLRAELKGAIADGVVASPRGGDEDHDNTDSPR